MEVEKAEVSLGPKPRPAVRLRVVVWTLLLGPPAIFLVHLSLPEARPTSVNRSFNGDGPINVTEEGIARKGYDAVAYHEEQSAVKGLGTFAAERSGAVFHFASRANRDRFFQTTSLRASIGIGVSTASPASNVQPPTGRRCAQPMAGVGAMPVESVVGRL